MHKLTIVLKNIKDRPALLSFLFTTTFIVLLCLAFEPRWETNDDVGMSMIAHGYGSVAYGSPNLIFSNVLWGYVVRAIPSINGVLGYSLATMAVLLAVGWSILYFLLRLGAGCLFGFLAVTLLLLQPTIFPQFTINAGLLMVAAVIGWQAYTRCGGIGSLLAACLLAFFGYLIRNNEFYLVLGVALPFLPWRALKERRQAQIAFLLLSVAIASAAAINRQAYSAPEWQYFLQLNRPRVSFTDFGADEHLKQRPDIMARHGYSNNDIDLIRGWFFVDPKIADPKALKEMLDELGPMSMQKDSVTSGFSAIRKLIDPTLLPLLLSGFVLFALAPRYSVCLAWILCLVALFATGVMGRPGILRVYVPLVSFLLIVPIACGQLQDRFRRYIAVFTLIFALVWEACLLIPQSVASRDMTQQVRKDILELSAGPIVSWGAAFPSVYAFPVLSNDPYPRKIKLYNLGTSTHAPFSVPVAELKAGRGMLERLRTMEGVPIIAIPQKIDLLGIYCDERLNGRLQVIAIHQTPSFTLKQVRCEENK